jgi:hypothetical protein
MAIDWNLVTTVLTIVTILLVIYWNHKQYQQMQRELKIQNRQLIIQNQQIKLSFFAEYTKRYQNILSHFPENIKSADFSYAKLDGPTRAETMRYMRLYFDLCSEEYFLHRNGNLDKEVWKEWEARMTFLFLKPAYREAWNLIKSDSDFYNDFDRFVQLKMQ